MLVPARYLQRCPVSNCGLWLQKTDYHASWRCPCCGWVGDRHLFVRVVWTNDDH